MEPGWRTGRHHVAMKRSLGSPAIASASAAMGSAGLMVFLAACASSAKATATPELTQGPYYLNLNLVRPEITEGHAGAALALTLSVPNFANGKPIQGAVVNLWHADGMGVYSGFVSTSQAGNGGGGGNPPAGGGGAGSPLPPGGGGGTNNGKGDGTTFCRGTQLTDASGNLTFTTVNPGWCQGRGGSATGIAPTKSTYGYAASLAMGVQTA